MTAKESSKELVLVSGYYGFGNLGDEAILEQIIADLARLVARENIVILSQDPQATEKTFSVKAVNRWKLKELTALFGKAKLFVSGGGGLYQDVSSLRSVVYYAGLAFLAKAARVPTIVYAQGVGPLRRTMAKTLTRAAISQASTITVRDKASYEMLTKWGLKPHLTADPVWCLAPGQLPEGLVAQLSAQRANHASSDRHPISDKEIAHPISDKERPLIGLSLRKTHDITIDDVGKFVQAIIEGTPPGAVLVPLVLYPEQDQELLEVACRSWESSGRAVLRLQTRDLRPSQWLKLIGELDLMIAMRFHALLMALRSGVASVGLAYDPKVAYLMERCQQPFLNLATATSDAKQLTKLVCDALGNARALGSRAREQTVESEALACQNFELLARILNMQSAGKIAQ